MYNCVDKNQDKIKNLSAEDKITELCSELIKKIDRNNKVTLNQFSTVFEENFNELSQNINKMTWFEFHRESTSDERKTFLLSQFLNLPDKTVNSIQGLSEGSIRYRVSECYHKLSKVLKYG